VLATTAVRRSRRARTFVQLGGTGAAADTDRVVVGRPNVDGTYRYFLLPGTVVEKTASRAATRACASTASSRRGSTPTTRASCRPATRRDAGWRAARA
jgi:hypothetical protein